MSISVALPVGGEILRARYSACSLNIHSRLACAEKGASDDRHGYALVLPTIVTETGMGNLSTPSHDDLKDAISLGECQPLDASVVHTRNSTYELIVLRGDKGEVLVRGGPRIPTVRRAWF